MNAIREWSKRKTDAGTYCEPAGWKKTPSPFHGRGGFPYGYTWNGWSIFRGDRRGAGSEPHRMFVVLRGPSLRPLEKFTSLEEARAWCETQGGAP
jgi:hypothetical protein